jgi:hypothetical protein
MGRSFRTLVVFAGLALAACLEPVAEPGDAGLDGGPIDSGVTQAGSADGGAADGGPSEDGGGIDSGLLDAGANDGGEVDAGAPDAGAPDAGAPDAGALDAGALDAGASDAGAPDAGGPPCSASNPCLATDYRLEQSPDCGTYCYLDELHNVAMNGPGQGSNPAGYDAYAPGQLIDGLRGDPDYTVNMGAAWVGWLYRNASIVFRFSSGRTFSGLRVGVNNHATGGIYAPSEIHVQLSDDDQAFGAPYVFRRASGTLPMVPVGSRGDVLLSLPNPSGRFVRVTLVYSSTWTMIDEVEFL